MSMATAAHPPTARLVNVICPVCTNAHFRRVILRAAPGSVVEAFCWKCKRYRKIVRIPLDAPRDMIGP